MDNFIQIMKLYSNLFQTLQNVSVYLSLRLCIIITTRFQKRSEQCSPVGMGPWRRQCLTLIFQYQDSTLIIICKTLLTTVSVLHLIHVHTSPRQDVPRPQQSLEFDFEILTIFSNFRTCLLSTPQLPGGHKEVESW